MMAVHADQLIAGPDPCFFSCAAAQDTSDAYHRDYPSFVIPRSCS
jgi:hypothetical protein